MSASALRDKTALVLDELLAQREADAVVASCHEDARLCRVVGAFSTAHVLSSRLSEPPADGGHISCLAGFARFEVTPQKQNPNCYI